MAKSSLILFSETLAGKYSNKDQAQENPRYFANINIYFVPLSWSIFQGPGFYSEQSFDYSPWSPYRQGLHKLYQKKDILIMNNYQLERPERLAGAGFRPELLNDLKNISATPRLGCAMYFKEVKPGHYQGSVEPGKKCLIKRDDCLTYLKSKVEFNDYSWTSLDQGFDIETNKLKWGSEYGPLKFKRLSNLSNEIRKNWPTES